MEKRKIALVTAAAGAGIGASIARQLVDDGLDVVITDVHERRCGELAAELSEKHGREFLSKPLDVTDYNKVGNVIQEIIEQRGQIDVLVNNAGWNKLEPVAEMSRETWLSCIDVDLNGTFNCMRHVLPYMIQRNFGSVVNISSIAAMVGNPSSTAYATAKGAIRSFTKSAAIQLAGDGIRVNSLHPGFADTPFTVDSLGDPAVLKRRLSGIPMGRLATAQEVANAILFLASDESSYVTGAELVVDGGCLAQ